MGVNTKKILKAIKKKEIDNMEVNELEILLGLRTAIIDQLISTDQAFPEE